MQAEEHHIKITKTAHYYTFGKMGNQTRFIWIAAHGYGQTAERFIQKFQILDPDENFIIAPEALSRFYWNGVNGRFAASWMTSKNRLEEIDDFCNYLDQIYHLYVANQGTAKVIFFGFSQGSTTLYRWIHKRKPAFNYFINWAGWFPEDIPMKNVNHLFNDQTHMIVIGNEDEYFTEERIRMMKEILQKETFDPKFIVYNGTHRVDSAILQEVVKNRLL